MEKNLRKKSGGFTLIELMIVVAIIAVIAVFAYPAYQDYILKANRGVAKSELMKVAARQEEFFADNKGYATDLTSLEYPASPYFINNRGEATDAVADNSIYSIGFAAGNDDMDFTLEAVPRKRQADDSTCGTLTYSNRGQKGITGTGDIDDCW